MFILRAPQPTRERPVRISAFEHVGDVAPVEHACTLGELLDDPESLAQVSKGGAQLFSFARFGDEGEGRVDSRVTHVDHLVFDADRLEPPILRGELDELLGRLAGVACAAYSTWQSRPDRLRLRLVVLLARPLAAAEYRRAWRACAGRYAVPIGDAKSQNESRAFYAPSCAPGREAEFVLVFQDGEPLDPDDLVPPRAPQGPQTGRAFAGVSKLPPPIERAPRPGQRNEELFRYACSLRRRGLDEGEIAAAVGARNARLADPLGEAEVDLLCRSSTRYAPDPELMEAQRRQDERVAGAPRPPLEVGDHVEVAREELAAMGWVEGAAEPLVVGDRGDVYAYDHASGAWRPAHQADLRARVDEHSGRDVQRPGLTKAGEPYAPVPLKITHAFAVGTVRTMIDLAGRPGYFDQRAPGVAFHDCHVRVEPGELVPEDHAPGNRALSVLPHDFDPSPAAPLWDRFLADLQFPPDVVRYLHEYLGACLVGDVVRYKTCLILVGGGDNGKSVLLDVAQACFPPGSVASVRPGDWGKRFVLASLVDAQLNVVDEVPGTKIQDADVFKAVVSGGRVRGERKYEGAFEFRPRCGHVFAANALPSTADRTDGFFTRWGVVPLTRTFQRSEMDHHLKDRLMTEVPAIASRLVAAAARLARRGRLELPEVVERAREEWRARDDHAARFALELAPDPGAAVKTDDLYRAFVRWCEHEERVPAADVPSKKSFGRAMARAGHEHVEHGGGPRAWRVRFSPFSGLQ